MQEAGEAEDEIDEDEEEEADEEIEGELLADPPQTVNCLNFEIASSYKIIRVGHFQRP